MLSFLFDERHRVLLSRFSGTLTRDDVERQAGLVRALEEREGVMRLILDFTELGSVEVETSREGRRPRRRTD